MVRPRPRRESIGATLRARSDPLFDIDALPRIVEIDLDRIDAHPDQPRKAIDADGLAELAASIERHGLLQPIVVQAAGDDRYVLVAGQRRLLAHRELGRSRIAALLSSGDREELALIENLQRETLPPLDEAEALAGLKRRHGYSQDELAKALAKAKSTISELLSLDQLPDALKADVRAQPRPVSKSVLIEIARLDDGDRQTALWERLKAGGTVRDARRVKSRPSAPARTAGSADELARLARTSDRLLRGLEAVTVAGLKRDPDLVARLRDLHRRLEGILADG
jgi:ParB family chromosome partitioning protein